MSISGRFLPHRVTIVRRVVTLDDEDQPVLDDYGQPVTTESIVAADVAAGIQPKKATELAALSQAGAATASHTIYLRPTDLGTADAIVHDASQCPVRVDLPDSTYQVVGVPDAAGAGHHLEVNADAVSGQQVAYATPVGVGS